MSNENQETKSPYKAYSPHRKGGPAKRSPPKKSHTWQLREMGDTAEANKTITASSLAEALKIYAGEKWDRKAAFLLPVYVKIVGERYIRCVHPEGRIEIMSW